MTLVYRMLWLTRLASGAGLLGRCLSLWSAYRYGRGGKGKSFVVAVVMFDGTGGEG
jgi:hypothetical protein